MSNSKYNSQKNLTRFAIATAVILLVPLVAMQFSDEVNWTPSDFIFAGIALFGSGFVYEMSTRNLSNPNHRVIVGLVVAAVLLFVWVAGATGFERFLGD